MISSWQREDSFVTYLFGMFHWRLKEALRAYDRRRLVPMPEGEIADSPDSSAAVVALERLLASLPERQRLIVHIRLSGGLSFAEISAVLGLSPRTIQRDMEAIAETVLRSGDR